MTTKMHRLGTVKALDDNEPNGAFEVILSAPTLDRDGEIVATKAFDPLPDHITFDIDHGMSTATTVGSGTPYYDGDVLKVKGTFSSIPRAQEVRTLVKEGHIRTTSVAFMAAQREQKDGVPTIVRAELLNGAFVPIPSNRESVVLSAKSFDEKVGARNSGSDAERLQSIHDLAVANGALCETKTLRHRHTAVARKGHGMTANDLRDIVRAAVQAAHANSDTDQYVWLRDYTDEWAVFEVYGGGLETLYQQAYTVTGRTAAMTGDAVQVTPRTVYEPVTTSSTTDSAPEPADAEASAKALASAVARARATAVSVSLPVT